MCGRPETSITVGQLRTVRICWMSLGVRPDHIVWQLLQRNADSDWSGLASSARELATMCAEFEHWAAYIGAGCEAMQQRARVGHRMLTDSLERGGWWSAPTLRDPSLAAIWDHDRPPRVRRASISRWRSAQGAARVRLRPIPSAVGEPGLLTFHGAGPTSQEGLTDIWGAVSGFEVTSVLSSQLVSPAVADWRRSDIAFRDVDEAFRTVRACGRPDIWPVLSGLGAGGRLAVEFALTGPHDVGAVLAVAPSFSRHTIDGIVGGAVRSCPVHLVPGGFADSRRSCRVLADALESIRIPCVIHDVDGLGHEYPSLPTFAEIVADVRRCLE